MKTFVSDSNGEHELKDYDEFHTWIQNVIQYFETCEYSSLPLLPSNILEGTQIFQRASPQEQGMIFNILYSYMIQSLKHWRNDLDVLYGNKADPLKEWELFKPFMSKKIRFPIDLA